MIRNVIKGLVVLLAVATLLSCSKHDPRVLQGYIEGEFIYVASNLSGDLKALDVTRGDQVKKGQRLFVLDPYPQEAQLQQAESDLARAEHQLTNLIKGQRSTIIQRIMAQLRTARADLSLAKVTLKRDQALYKQGAVGKARLDNSITGYRTASQKVKEIEANLAEAKLGARTDQIKAQESQVAAAKQKVKELKWQLQQKTQVAPKDARVNDTFFKKGEFVPAGQAVVSLLSPQDMKLVFYVPEPLLSQIKIGEYVSFDCDGCKTKTKARVYYVSQKAEYTPPVIYSKDTRHKLMFRVEAWLSAKDAVNFNAGQPVTIYLPKDPREMNPNKK